MKWLVYLSFFGVLAVLMTLDGCSSSSPAPATIDGKWTYTTSDGKMKVTFELATNTSGVLEIKNPAAITVNGASGNAAAQMSSVSLPNIGSIIINANDVALTYSHIITFSSCKFVSSTNKIDVANGSYTIFAPGISGGTTTPFATVSIGRP